MTHINAMKQALEAWHHPECEGECIACLIEREVKQAYGTQGLAYLRRHVAAPPQQEKQEPVAAQHRFRHPQKTMPDWSPWQPADVSDRPSWEIDSQGYEVEYRLLYPAPPQRQPLTEGEIREIAKGYALGLAFPYDGPTTPEMFARAIERAHGIGVKHDY